MFPWARCLPMSEWVAWVTERRGNEGRRGEACSHYHSMTTHSCPLIPPWAKPPWISATAILCLVTDSVRSICGRFILASYTRSDNAICLYGREEREPGNISLFHLCARINVIYFSHLISQSCQSCTVYRDRYYDIVGAILDTS